MTTTFSPAISIYWNYETFTPGLMTRFELDFKLEEIDRVLGWTLTQAENNQITYKTYKGFENECMAAAGAIEKEIKAREARGNSNA